MSALLPIADIRQRIEHVCFVPRTDIAAPQMLERAVNKGMPWPCGRAQLPHERRAPT